ncbi:hypothetical protein [Mycobacterium colombiense]|uniref:hypothetical protein n=1 Tax=Mycobacterium colombiense TaxID=339268 RepID=UPI0014022262|nr:hypothetical protein [Mycobacterium colombiense]
MTQVEAGTLRPLVVSRRGAARGHRGGRRKETFGRLHRISSPKNRADLQMGYHYDQD